MTDTKKLLEDIIKTKVLEALSTESQLIDRLVSSAINQPVEEYTGRKEGSYGSKMVPFLDYLVGDVIRSAVRDAVIVRIVEMKDTIHAEVAKRLSEKDLIDSFSAAVLKATEDEWRINVSIEKEKERRI